MTQRHVPDSLRLIWASVVICLLAAGAWSKGQLDARDRLGCSVDATSEAAPVPVRRGPPDGHADPSFLAPAAATFTKAPVLIAVVGSHRAPDNGQLDFYVHTRSSRGPPHG